MFVKLGVNVWLVVTAVVVFPAMLYLTRTVPDDNVDHTEHVSVNRSETLFAPAQESKQAVLSTGSSVAVTSSENTASPVEASNSDFDDRSDMAIDEPDHLRREQTYRSGDKRTLASETYIRKSDTLPVKSRSGNTAAVNYYTVGGGNARQTAATVTESPAVTDVREENGVKNKPTPSRVSSQARLTGTDNSMLSPLYTAEIQKPQNIKPKCPPVYMSVNAYARNMRIAMGCDDNP